MSNIVLNTVDQIYSLLIQSCDLAGGYENNAMIHLG